MLNSTYISGVIRGSETVAVGVLTSKLPEDELIANDQITFTDGNGANKAEHVGSMSASLGSGASSTFDLTAFSGLGGNVNFAKIKGLRLKNNGTNAADIVEFGNAASNAWTSFIATKITLPPNSFLILGTASIAGLLVSGTNKNLKALNLGTNTFTVEVGLIGED